MRATIGIIPRAAYTRRTKLFSTLESLFAVNFEPRSAGECDHLDAVVVFSEPDAPRLTYRCPSLTHLEPRTSMASGEVTFSDAPLVDRRLRGRRLEHGGRGVLGLEARPGDTVLATFGGAPLWIAEGEGLHCIVGCDASEIGPRETLRSSLQPGRFMGLLPLIHLLRRVQGKSAWVPPPLRATILIDDPHIRRRNYGFINFKRFARQASRNGYHVSFATIPIDLWAPHPEMLKLFQTHKQQLSLAVHGNNHLKHELFRTDVDETAAPIAAQALSRVSRFETRYGLPVDKVMVPPHARCTRAMRRVMARLGFEAVVLDKEEFWNERPDSPDGLLAGWQPAQVMAGEVPVLLRQNLPFAGGSFQTAILDAFLDQPLIFSGHHWDFCDGTDQLDAFVRELNSIGGIQWMSPQAIARSNYAWRMNGNALQLLLFSHKVTIPGGDELEITAALPSANDRFDAPIRVQAGAASGPRVVSLVHPSPISPSDVRLPPLKVWPHLRRAFTETRDFIEIWRKGSSARTPASLTELKVLTATCGIRILELADQLVL